jgi:hypothetical protein
MKINSKEKERGKDGKTVTNKEGRQNIGIREG